MQQMPSFSQRAIGAIEVNQRIILTQMYIMKREYGKNVHTSVQCGQITLNLGCKADLKTHSNKFDIINVFMHTYFFSFLL